MKGLTPGRIVHFVMPDGDHRPAIVVEVWDDKEYVDYPEGTINMLVFVDGSNDVPHIPTDDPKEHAYNILMQRVQWQTSIHFDETEKKTGTWHWIEPA